MKYEIFEIHITGDESIINVCKTMNIKTIIVDLLKPNKDVLRSEFMTSFVAKFPDFNSCFNYVSGIESTLKDFGVDVVRSKIESPYYDHYNDISLYMETHYPTCDNNRAISKNRHKRTILATERVYKQAEYQLFRNLHKGKEIELCLYDTNVNEDKDWLSLYPS